MLITQMPIIQTLLRWWYDAIALCKQQSVIQHSSTFKKDERLGIDKKSNKLKTKK